MSKVDYNEIKTKEVAPVGKETEVEVNIKVKPDVKPLVSSEKPRKKGLTERLVAGLAGPRGIKAAGSYVGKEIVLPTLRNLLFDGAKSALEVMIFGEDGRRPNNSNSGAWNQPNYNGGSYGTSRHQTRTNYASASRGSSVGAARRTQGPLETAIYATEFILANRDDAKAVLDQMMYFADQYGQVDLATYYELIGQPTSYTDSQYGWFELADARIRTVRGGVIIDLPMLDVL